MHNVMVDIESLGKGPLAPILAIAAVFFDLKTGEVGPSFYAIVDLASELELGAKPDADTIYWWLAQSEAARAAITAKPRGKNVDVLKRLGGFIKTHCSDLGRVQVWGNGATFDNTILRSAYQRCGIEPFWCFWNDCDVRTTVKAGLEIGFNPKKEMPFVGEMHNALDDAIHQVKYVSAIWQKITVPRV
ncbi:TPA: 3'-5' exonuclease [Serratia marcescens]|uniref:3'-5' exonuclease n=1 Tax=Serratia marcescens TaxID=615 RepID=UPI002F28D379